MEIKENLAVGHVAVLELLELIMTALHLATGPDTPVVGTVSKVI